MIQKWQNTIALLQSFAEFKSNDWMKVIYSYLDLPFTGRYVERIWFLSWITYTIAIFCLNSKLVSGTRNQVVNSYLEIKLHFAIQWHWSIRQNANSIDDCDVWKLFTKIRYTLVRCQLRRNVYEAYERNS